MVPPEDSVTEPSAAAATVSIFSSAPPRPRKMTDSPHALSRASWSRCEMKRLPTRPMSPPATMQHTLMMVPTPGMGIASFDSAGYRSRGLRPRREEARHVRKARPAYCPRRPAPGAGLCRERPGRRACARPLVWRRLPVCHLPRKTPYGAGFRVLPRVRPRARGRPRAVPARARGRRGRLRRAQARARAAPRGVDRRRRDRPQGDRGGAPLVLRRRRLCARLLCRRIRLYPRRRPARQEIRPHRARRVLGRRARGIPCRR